MGQKKSYIVYFLLLNLIVAFTFISSCKKENTPKPIKVLQANPDGFTLTIENTISLSNLRNALVGFVSTVEMTDEMIFVFDNRIYRGLSVFDHSGQFLWRSLIGKGPGEVTIPTGFKIIDNYVNIIDGYSIKIFDLNGNYIRSKKIPTGFILHDFELVAKDRYLTYGASPRIGAYNENKPENFPPLYNFHLVDTGLSKSYYWHSEIDPEFTALSCDHSLSKLGKEFLTLSKLDNNIYMFKDNSFRKEYYVDFESYNITEKDLENGIHHLLELSVNGSKLGFLDNIYQTLHFLSFSYNGSDGKPIHVLTSKEHLNCTTWIELLIRFDLPKMNLVGCTNDLFILCFNPGDFSNEEIRQYINNGMLPEKTTNNSNPILVLVSVDYKQNN